MKLAFCLFKYFPFGGLQRDFLKIAKECIARGHEVTVFTMQWDAPFDADMHIHVIPIKGWQNHSRCRNFVETIAPRLSSYDLVIGFNKMPYLDVYFAADPCFKAKVKHQHGLWYRLTPRYRQWLSYEKALFKPSSKTQALLLSQKQQHEFSEHYQTQTSRLQLLPPGILKKDLPAHRVLETRQQVRHNFGIAADELLLLLVGSGFKTKGLDRALKAFAKLPTEIKQKTHFFIIGQDRAKTFVKQAQALHIDARIKFLGGRQDVPDFLYAADLLIHPAYYENTGTVLLEALAAGLPVLTTDICGYASYIHKARAGIVLMSPFNQEQCNKSLVTMLSAHEQRILWKQNALAFSQQADIYSLTTHAVDAIEKYL